MPVGRADRAGCDSPHFNSGRNGEMSTIFSEIPGAGTWSTVEAIDKGWSQDKKYHIKTTDGRELLLRLSDISEYGNKKREFTAVKRLEQLDIAMSRPIELGVCHNGQFVYSLFTWVDGEDAGQVIPAASPEEQYRLGVVTGKYLCRMHQVPAEENLPPWAGRYQQKINNYIANYRACGIQFEGAHIFIDFIEQNRYLLEQRRYQSFQHGDYHVGNMVVTQTGELGIIDFNRFDYGDPWEEFNRITWCAGLSGLFASGRINGYFDDDVPESFFRVMALYIACNQLSSIYWAIPFGHEEVNIMLKRAETVLQWYDDFRTFVPNWYVPGRTI